MGLKASYLMSIIGNNEYTFNASRYHHLHNKLLKYGDNHQDGIQWYELQALGYKPIGFLVYSTILKILGWANPYNEVKL